MRLGLGIGAAAVAPALLKGVEEYHETDEGKEQLKQVQEQSKKTFHREATISTVWF